jgi:selenocysteine lyase/cysteine desulfurase
VNLAINLLAPDPAGNVVTTDLEFMTDTYAVLGRSPAPELRVVESVGGEVPVEALAARIDERTQFVLISHVTVGSGFRHDLAAVGAVAAERGVPLVVDVAQSVGAIPVDLQGAGVAFAAGTCSKWLLGGAGVGFLYVHPDYQELAPVAPGWFAAANADDWDLLAPQFHSSAQRFQGGIPNILGLFAAAAGARIIQDITIETVSAAIGHLTEYLLDGLTPLGVDVWTPREPSKHAGLVFLRGVDDAALYAEARSANVVVGRFLSGIRIDPHFFNTTDELDVVLGLVAKQRLGR